MYDDITEYKRDRDGTRQEMSPQSVRKQKEMDDMTIKINVDFEKNNFESRLNILGYK